MWRRYLTAILLMAATSLVSAEDFVLGIRIASNAMLAPANADFEVLPPSPAVAAAGERLKAGETRVVQNNEVLTFTHRSEGEAVSVTGGTMQRLPMTRVAGTDIWILQLKRAAWDEAFFSYAIVEDGCRASCGRRCCTAVSWTKIEGSRSACHPYGGVARLRCY